MYRIMLQKLWHKKWMNLCLLLGSILLIATVVSFPLYQTAAYDRMLQDEFRDFISTKGGWPAMNSMSILSSQDRHGTAIAQMEDLMGNIYKDLGVTEKETVRYYNLAVMRVRSAWNRDDVQDTDVKLGAMTGLPEHAVMLNGEMYSENGCTEDGAIEVVVSQTAMVKLKILVGETLIFNGMKDADGKEIRLYVKGVYDIADHNDFYWQVDPNKMDNVCLMNMDLFQRMFTGDNAARYSISCNYYTLFEYEDIKASDVAGLMEATDYLTDKSAYRSTVNTPPYREVLERYNAKLERIRATLVILQIPVLIMLGAFLFMISGQMYDMERNEISVIKSRGSSGGQIFRLYLYQSLFLALVGGALGIPLGAVFSRILGSARSFLEFSANKPLKLTFTVDVWIYAAAAMAATLLIMTLPAIKHSRVTIVNLKQQKALKKKSLWEKLFLDIILLGLSLYGYYNFHKNSAKLAENVLRGEALDPLLYISSSLFIVGLGLFFLRIQPYLVQLIYTLGKRFWKPASYASFMENIKNGRKQQFIMLFLIMTISLGMYHATVARTILKNAGDNTDYLCGADLVFKEVWIEAADEHGNSTGKFIEPDYFRFASMDFADGYTRVQVEPDAYIKKGDQLVRTIAMGVHTKEFGSITWVDYDLNNQHYYEALNALAVDADGVLLSENFHGKLGYEIGDTIEYMRGTNRSSAISGKVVGFVSYFPGYEPSSSSVNPDGTVTTAENYLVVAHFDKMTKKWDATPYEIWCSVKEGYKPQDVYRWFEDNNIRLKKYVNRSVQMESTLTDPLLQGTNGVLTMGFIVTILLCAVGYLIYWILSIRSREMIFGVLRACGMHKGELIQMLLNEQIFSGVFSIFAGIGIGKLTSRMFVPMLQQAYAATNQVLPLKLVVNTSDMVRLYSVIAAVMVICLAVLILLLFKLNVTKALKLGEE